MATSNQEVFARDPLGSLRRASAYAERALLGALSPGFGAIFLALGYAALQAGTSYRGLWVIGVLALMLAAAHWLLPRRVTGDIWLTPLSLTVLFIAAGQTIVIAGVPLAAMLTALFAAVYGALVWLRKVAAADVLIFLAVGPIFMTTPELLSSARDQGWLWYEIAIAAVMTLVGGAVVWRRSFLSALIVLSAFFYYSIWVPFSLTVSLGPQSEQAVAAQQAVEASQSYYTFLLSMGAAPILISATWAPFLLIVLAMHWRDRRANVGAAKAFLDQSIVSAALGVVALYGVYAIVPQTPMRYLFDLNAALFCAWLGLLITQNRGRWGPYGALIWLVALQRVASHMSLIEMGLAIALYAAATIALGGGLLASRMSGAIPSDATRKFVALLIVVNVAASLMFVNAEFERQQAMRVLRQPEFEIYPALYLLILAAVVAGVSAALLRSLPPTPESIWRGQLLSARAGAVLRRYLIGFWGRSKKLEDFPFFSQGEALMRHLRGDDRSDLVSIVVFIALVVYMGWATLFGPLAPFISVIDPVPGDSGGARVVQFGLLAYLIGRITRFRLYAYAGVFAILWSGVAALDLGSWGEFAESSPAQTGGFSEIAGPGAATALFLHRLASFLGPHVIVPGVGLIACEVIRMLVDPLRERIAVRLAPIGVADGATAAAGARPRWLMPAAAGASVLVAIMVVLASWGGSGAAIVDGMARRTAQVEAPATNVVLRMGAMAPASVAGGRLTMQSIQFADWREATPESIAVSASDGPPAAIVQARLDLPEGDMRQVSYTIFRDGAGVRIVLQLSPIIRLAEADAYGALNPSLGRGQRSDDDEVYAALKSHIETVVGGSPSVAGDLDGIAFTTLQARPFLYVRTTAPAGDAGGATDAALASAGAALQRSGLVGYSEPLVVHLPGGAILAGYAYEDFGETIDAATLGEAQLGRTPEGRSLQLGFSGPETGAAAVQQRLLAAAQSAGLQVGAMVEQRAAVVVTEVDAAEMDSAGADTGAARDVSRKYNLIVTGAVSNLGCMLSAISSGYGYCDLSQPAP
jgi:hypothetical protein